MEKASDYDAEGDDPEIHSIFYVACFYVFVDFIELEQPAF